MATIVNERDVLLQGAASRLVGITLPPNVDIPALTGVTLTATSQTFQIPETGSIYPSEITLKAIVRNLTALPSLTLEEGTMTVTPNLDGDKKFTFTPDEMTSDLLKFKVTIMEPDIGGGPDVEYTDEFTILKAREGAGALIAYLTNESFTVAADEDGVVTSYTGAAGSFRVIKGIEDVTASCTFSVVDNPNSLTVSIDPGGGGAGTYTVTGGFADADDTATVTFRAVYDNDPDPDLELDKVFSLAKAKAGVQGDDGDTGADGQKYAQVYLYAWSTSQPANPNGSSTYTWATAAHTSFSGTTWSTTIGSNPGIAGIKLWIAQQQITATGPTTSSTVTWNSGGTGYTVYAQGQNGNDGTDGTDGTNGTNGLKSATPTVFQWASSIPSGPSGSDTYNWSTGGYSGPSGIGTTWHFTPPTSPSPGFTLWAAIVNVSDTVTATSTGFNWTGASIQARGYAGNTGGSGQQGASARYGYSRIGGNPSASGTTATVAGDNRPSSSESSAAWGGSFAVTWSASDPNPSSNDTLYQIDGIYNPATSQTVWSAPYISSLKVGTLSAVAVNTGNLTANGNITVTGSILGGNFTSSAWPSSGGGFYLDPTLLRLGRFASGQYFEVTAAGALSMPGLTVSGGSATFSGTLSAVTGTFNTVTANASITLGGGGMINSGAFSSFAWPASGTGFHLGPSGLLMGNVNTGGFVQIYADGSNITFGKLPGPYLQWVSSSGGSLTLSGASLSAGTITGSVIQTAASGTRVAINESSGNDIRFYDGSSMLARMGIDSTYNSYLFAGSTSSTRIGGYFMAGSATAIAAYSNSSYGITATAASGTNLAGVYGTGVGGNHGLHGISTGAGAGVVGSSTTGIAVWATGNGTLKADGPFGCNGNTPQSKYTVNGACSDLATAIALTNQLRAALIANGICV